VETEIRVLAPLELVTTDTPMLRIHIFLRLDLQKMFKAN